MLVDAQVVDSSGNHASLSEVAFTGDKIEERALNLLVSNERILISNALQTPIIVPYVEFEFRGLVALGGSGSGITYSSSHPSLVSVNSEGRLFAFVFLHF